MRRIFFLLIFVFIYSFNSFSQKGMTVVGIQVKPIFPFSFLGTGLITNDVDGVHFETSLVSGFSAGMVVRHNFTNLIAFETGINYVKRKYSLTISESDFKDESDFRIVSYEIPAVVMIYSQLGENIYINGSMGPTMDMFPGSIQTFDDYFNHISFRNHVFQPAITVNFGFEYRTKKSGILYLGASYQRPFEFIYLSKVTYERNTKMAAVENELTGSYLTIDLRYFFPETKTKNASE